MCLSQVILIAEGLVHHGADLLDDLEVLVREDVGETQNGVVTDYTREVELFAICLNSDLRGKEETVDGIDHGDRGKSC